jgi:hypothetical protein
MTSEGAIAAGAPVMLSSAFDRGVAFARVVHASQRRKAQGAPYLCHLLAVAGLVLEYGGDEVQTVAALLHDTIEDQADAHGGAEALRCAIRDRFGAAVLALVEVCSDCDSKPKPPWILRKRAHLARLREASAYQCLIPACDKLHNLRCINAELRAGLDPFNMLHAGAPEQLALFEAMTDLFEEKRPAVARDLRSELAVLRKLLKQRQHRAPARKHASVANAIPLGCPVPC